MVEEIHIVKNGTGISFQTDHDKAAWSEIHDGNICITVRRPRNAKYAAWVHSLIDRLAENWPDGEITHEQGLLWLKLKTGLCHIATYEGTDVVVPDSIAFDSMAQEPFKQWWEGLALPAVAAKLGCEVEALIENLPGASAHKKCANPSCSNPASDRHHIWGGTAWRQRSEELGLVVFICRKCHELSEIGGLIKGNVPIANRSMSNIEYYRRLWCSVLKVDYDEALSKVQSGTKKYKLEAMNERRHTP